MHRRLIFSVLASICFAPVAHAEDAGDHNETLVTDCSNLPTDASIGVFSRAETVRFCQKASVILEGMRIKDIRMFEKGAAVIHFEHCGDGDLSDALAQLLEIVRIRGHYNLPDRWYGTADLIARTCQVYKGLVPPAAVIGLLRGAGQFSKTLSDEGLKKMIILMKIQHQQGD